MAALVLCLAAAGQASAQREIAPEPLPPHPVIQRDLALTDMRVDIHIDGAVARTTLRQTLRNDGGGMAEGKYMLPLPPGATVSDFAIIDGDQRLTGEVLDADEARQTYQQIVRQMRDPGLLEYQDSQTFSVAVFPFNPGDSRTVEVSFTQTLSGTGQLQGYYLPLRWAGWSRCNNTSFVLNYEINSNYELGAISSPTHGITVNRDGDYRARGSYEERLNDFSTDFSLNIGRRTDEFAASLICFPGEGNEDGYFLLSLLAALPQNDTYIPKDVVFIIDKSGSMAGEKIEQAKNALKFVLDRLKSEDRFGIVFYDDVITPLWDELHTASADNLRQAREEVSALTDGGSTDIDQALKTGAGLINGRERPAYAVFLTDGLPTAGECDIDNIVNNAKARFDADVKLFVFGVGYDVNTTLLDSLSYNHHGSATYVSPNENLESKVSEFYGKMSSPALVDIAIELDGLDDYDIMPRELPDLFHNNEIHITGRFHGTPDRNVHLTLLGDTENGRQKFMTEIDSNVSTGNHTVPRLWAARKVSYLLDQIRLLGDNQELIDEVDKLAMRFGIVTPYTSYLITEPDAYFDVQTRREQFAMEMEEARVDDTGAMAVGRSKLNQANQAADLAAAPQVAGGAAGGGDMDEGIRTSIELPWPNSGSTNRQGSATPGSTVNYVNNQTFVSQYNGARQASQWVDARFEPDRQDVIQVTSYGDTYFQLLDEFPELAEYLSQGEEIVVVVADDLALETVTEDVTNTSEEVDRLRRELGTGDYLASLPPAGLEKIERFRYFPEHDEDEPAQMLVAATTDSGGGPGAGYALRVIALGFGLFLFAAAAGVMTFALWRRTEHPVNPHSPDIAI
ncbi:VWA domain-containing protein [bacterium]|nr:VWA domain-containing protein [bacterium]